ncbi:MAG: phosphotransferase, partial [Candidatus Hydrogenedentales bacterium]
MNEVKQQALARRYELGEVVQCVPLDGTRNRNYVVRTTSGEWFVRMRYAGYSAQEWIDFDCAAMVFLHKRGVPVVPPRPAPNGQLCWNDGTSVWQVFPFVQGNTLTEGDIAQIRGLGKSLARFHAEGESFASRYEKLGPRGETCPSEILRISDAIESESPNCAAPLKRYREWIGEAAATLSGDRYSVL